MSHYGWHNCPKDVHRQVKGFVDAVRDALGDNLAGVYLHGSLAMGCFNAERSDIDLLVVTQRGMMIEEKRRVAELLLRHSAAPRPIEISFLSEQDLHPWQYPTPFDFHYGEDWREHYEKDLATDQWRKWNQDQHRDSDLAAHITVALNRGGSAFLASLSGKSFLLFRKNITLIPFTRTWDGGKTGWPKTQFITS
jgi:streptomycin 3"-adenylyltransferase